MATIADITIKKANGTTDIVWTAIAGSAGDKSPSMWRSETAATIRGYRPVFSLVARDNGPKTARRIEATVDFPVVRAINSVDTVVGKVPVTLSAVVSNSFTDAEIAEAIEQSLNLFAHVTTRASLKSGATPN